MASKPKDFTVDAVLAKHGFGSTTLFEVHEFALAEMWNKELKPAERTANARLLFSLAKDLVAMECRVRAAAMPRTKPTAAPTPAKANLLAEGLRTAGKGIHNLRIVG